MRARSKMAHKAMEEKKAAISKVGVSEEQILKNHSLAINRLLDLRLNIN